MITTTSLGSDIKTEPRRKKKKEEKKAGKEGKKKKKAQGPRTDPAANAAYPSASKSLKAY